MPAVPESLVDLARFRRFAESAPLRWPTFLERRCERVTQATRNVKAAEKVAENILEDFFTVSLDWKIEELNNQVRHTDIILTHNGIKRLTTKLPLSTKMQVSPALEHVLNKAQQLPARFNQQRVRLTSGASNRPPGMYQAVVPLDLLAAALQGPCEGTKLLQSAVFSISEDAFAPSIFAPTLLIVRSQPRFTARIGGHRSYTAGSPVRHR